VEQRSGNIFWHISKTALSLTLRQNLRPQVHENRVLRKMFGFREEV